MSAPRPRAAESPPGMERVTYESPLAFSHRSICAGTTLGRLNGGGKEDHEEGRGDRRPQPSRLAACGNRIIMPIATMAFTIERI